jgi:hypothetical protein
MQQEGCCHRIINLKSVSKRANWIRMLPPTSSFIQYHLKENKLFKPSALNLDIKGAQPLGADVHITGSKTITTDETYQLVVGKASKVHDHYNALQLELEENTAPGRKLIIEARAYNDAVAFRYIAPHSKPCRMGTNC